MTCNVNVVKAHSPMFKSAETALLHKEPTAQKCYILRANWYALAISILTEHDATAACRLMGVYEHRKVK